MAGAVLLLGPTACGKSALAMRLAARPGTLIEIVSIDSAQVYRGLDIGTAKPSVAKRATVELHRRIAARFDAMIAAGILDEVRALVARGDLYPDLPSLRAVGYRRTWRHLSQGSRFQGIPCRHGRRHAPARQAPARLAALDARCSHRRSVRGRCDRRIPSGHGSDAVSIRCTVSLGHARTPEQRVHLDVAHRVLGRLEGLLQQGERLLAALLLRDDVDRVGGLDLLGVDRLAVDAVEMRLTTGRSSVLAASTKPQPRIASSSRLAPAAQPTPAEPHSVAAVLMPRTLPSSRMITPAPRKPTPETT